MKIWIDDIRNAPDDSWNVCRTVTSAINAIHQFHFDITEISLDHDISHQITVGNFSRPLPCDETFRPVAYYIGLFFENEACHGRQWPVALSIHTANPAGAQELKNILNEYGLNPEITALPQVNRLEMTL